MRRALLLLVLTVPAALAAPCVASADDAARFDAARREVVSPRVDPAARVAAAEVLSRADSPEARALAVPPLLDALADPVPPVRMAAAEALARLGDERALGRLSGRLRGEGDPATLAALLLAIGRLGRAEDAATVAPFVEHPVPAVRAAAGIALGDLGGPAARE